MAREHSEKARARAKAWAPDFDAARRPAGLLIPDGIAGLTGRLRETISEWAAAEAAPGRMLPWVPVSFGLGIVGYLAADREPTWWASVTFALLTILVACLVRRRPIPLPVAANLAAMATGFATATLQTLHLAHPILLHLVSSALVAGFVEAREQREHGDRIVVGVQRFEAASIGSAPERVRVAVRKGTAPAVGSFVEFKAHLSPPLQPLRPGGYEFARDMYFQRIGASGYALVKVKSPPVAQGFWLRYASIIDALREGIDKRIRAVTGGDHGSIASALITGKRCDLGACQRCDVRFKPVICCFVPVRYWTVVQSAQDSGPRIHKTSS